MNTHQNNFSLTDKISHPNINPQSNTKNNIKQFFIKSNTFHKETFKIGSLNTRGLNNTTKLKCLLEYTKNQNYSIFGLSETKIKKTQQKFYLTKDSIIHWNSNDNSKAGVALIIKNTFSITI